MLAIDKSTTSFFGALTPPPKIPVSTWSKRTIRLSEQASATAGRFKPLPYQNFLLDIPKMADRNGNPVWKVVVKKAARVGLTVGQDVLTLNYLHNDPSSVLIVQPRHSDARASAIRLEGMCESTPALNDLLLYVRNDTDNRSDLLNRKGPGWSLKLTSATPANLRSVTAKVLIMDEVAAMQMSDEGNPIDLAIARTSTYANSGRLVYMGSTPTSWPDCLISREYENSWQYEWQTQCQHCKTHFTPMWQHMNWDKDGEGAHLPGTAHMVCPDCGGVHHEHDRADMVHAGRWHCVSDDGPPGVIGCYINALGSLLPSANWPDLVREFLAKKNDFLELASFTNLVLGETVREPHEEIGEPAALMGMAEPFDGDGVPDEAVMVTTGVDVQRDRLELTHIGWTSTGDPIVIDHVIIYGDTTAEKTDEVWAELEDELKRTFNRQDKRILRIKFAAIDSGDGVTTANVRAFCNPRFHRGVFAVKGVPGFDRPVFEHRSNAKSKHGKHLGLVGSDAAKSLVASYIRAERVRFSDTLHPDYFDQLVASERLETKMVRGVPRKMWKRVPGKAAESLDCFGYALAARYSNPRLDLQKIADSVMQQPVGSSKTLPKRSLADLGASLGSLNR